MHSRDASFGAPVMRQVLREEARKHMAGRVPGGSCEPKLKGLIKCNDHHLNASGALA